MRVTQGSPSQRGLASTLFGSSNDPNTGDIYSGLDRFGRVDNCLWQKGSTTLAQIQYGYDRASNRTWRKDGVLTGYDELYLYDGLNRLKDQIRGTLNGTQTAITSSTFQQQWGLDATGNWQAFNQDTDGNGTWDLVQSRTANKANEITAINNTTGTAWVTPGYDKAGNMIGIPNPTISSTATYDAWNRLIGVTDASTSITNDYDARGFRITETTGGVVRHYYYTPGWQCVEERTGTLTTVERQFVWGMRYIDDLVIRDRSTANNGSINERRYAMQDGNWNTVAICDITGSVGERYAYSAYGTPVFMTGAGTVQTSSPIGFETLYAGYRWDNATPQMYYVRNRFLLPLVGTWNKRDPLGYVDGMSLYPYVSALSSTDPSGLQDGTGLPPFSVAPWTTTVTGQLEIHDPSWLDDYVSINGMYDKGLLGLHPSWVEYSAVRDAGCVGVARSLLGKMELFDATTKCFYFPGDPKRALAAAEKWATKMKCKGSARPGYFAYNLWTHANSPYISSSGSGRNSNAINYCDVCGEVFKPRVPWAEIPPRPPSLPPGETWAPIHFDFCVRQSCGRWFGADHSPPNMHVLLWPTLEEFSSKYSNFDATIVCVTCSGDYFGASGNAWKLNIKTNPSW